LRWASRSRSSRHRRRRQAADLQLHQSLRGKADHLAQEIAVSRLPNQRLQVHLVLGHRWSPLVRVRNPTYPKITDGHPRKLTGRYSA
jgi:hypothetical protein